MKHRIPYRREGNVMVMTAVLMVVLIGFMALAVDVGYLCNVRSELQRSADAAAIAATWELVDRDCEADGDAVTLTNNARAAAAQFAALNKAGSEVPLLAGDDVNVGYMENPSDPSESLGAVPAGEQPNAVHVRVQRTDVQNGEIPLFFARVLGHDESASQAQATAAVLYGFNGFQKPSDNTNLPILPFALDEETWDNLPISGTDDWCYNPDTKTVTAGGDGIREVNLYPQGTGMPGNRGTVDIGGGNNSTSDICRQIRDGISPADMDALSAGGRTLEFNDDGDLFLNGDTGISAGCKDDLASIIGKPRIIPIFSTVVGPGNNAEYTIVKFVGVRITYVKLTGSMASKKVMIQPCNVVTKGGIYEPGANTTERIYSPVWLVR
jgi:Flp pilus assembly protein TadG